MPKVFISHSSKDKAFARKLAEMLQNAGVDIWIDEAEIKVGDSLIDKIGEGISETDFVAVILSQVSVNSQWVQAELNMAMQKQLAENKVGVLPILKEKCEIPPFLRDKLYADFTESSQFEESFNKILRALGVAIGRSPSSSSLQTKHRPNVGPSKSKPAGRPPTRTALEKFEDLSIIAVDKSRTYNPNEEYALFNVYLELSSHPPQEWVEIFDAERKFPRHSMWRRAWIDGGYIVVYCVPEELKQYHLVDLKEDVANSNRKYRGFLLRESTARDAAARRALREKQALDEALDDLKF